MASEVQRRDAGAEVKLGRPSAVATLSVITLGIYALFWYYKVNREMRDFGSTHGDHGLAASKPWRSIQILQAEMSVPASWLKESPAGRAGSRKADPECSGMPAASVLLAARSTTDRERGREARAGSKAGLGGPAWRAVPVTAGSGSVRRADGMT
jgi:hypothetical protein